MAWIGLRELIRLPRGQLERSLLAAGRDRQDESKGHDDGENAAAHAMRSRAAAMARRTVSGAVPPKLVRLATERSGVSTS